MKEDTFFNILQYVLLGFLGVLLSMGVAWSIWLFRHM